MLANVASAEEDKSEQTEGIIGPDRPGAGRSRPERPGAVRSRPELRGAARSGPERPGAGRSGPEAGRKRSGVQGAHLNPWASSYAPPCCCCPDRPGRLSALSVFLCKSVFYGVFVWARRALNSQKTVSGWRTGGRGGRPPPALAGAGRAVRAGGPPHHAARRPRGGGPPRVISDCHFRKPGIKWLNCTEK